MNPDPVSDAEQEIIAAITRNKSSLFKLFLLREECWKRYVRISEEIRQLEHRNRYLADLPARLRANPQLDLESVLEVLK